MSRYIDVDEAIKVMACEMYAEAQSQGYDVDGVEEFIPEATAWMNDAPSIDLDDYVPKEFHDKTCEAMAKRHQEEIADILERADADRPQGEWKSVKASIYPYGYDVECSVCGHRMGSSFGYKFCPMCGAQMKGADDETTT